MYETLAVLALFALLYSAIAGGVERTWISGPIIFTIFGLIIGPFGFDVLSMRSDPEMLKTLAELSLAIVLFTDAAEVNLGVLRRARKLPIRLLAIGLPLTIVLGAATGKLFFGAMGIIELALLATMLAPTDAALGKAVVMNRDVPEPMREGLNVESGLNDGICVPILLLFLTLAIGEESGEGALHMGLRLFARVVGVGLVTGALLSVAAVLLLRACGHRKWLDAAWMKITVVALAFACFGAAQALGGSGFIASFVGGMIFGAMIEPFRDQLLGAAEGIGDAFAMLTWVLFGSAVVGAAAGFFEWDTLLYALLSLTVIRMLPVFIAVSGLGLDLESKLFLGWFGPRGLASIVFIVIVIGEEVDYRGDMAVVVVCTVCLSVLLHGLTANPWAKGFGFRHRASGATE